MSKQIYTLVLVLISGAWLSFPATASDKITHTRYQTSGHHIIPASFYSHYKSRPNHSRRHDGYSRDYSRHERRHFRKHNHRAKHWGHHDYKRRHHDRYDNGPRHNRRYIKRHHDNHNYGLKNDGLRIGVYYEGYL